MTKKSKKNRTNDVSFGRWLMVALAGFVGGLFLPVREYREYGEVSTTHMLLPVLTMALGLGTTFLARLIARLGQD